MTYERCFVLLLSSVSILAHKYPSSDVNSNTIVHISSGDIQGSINKTWTNKEYMQFRGIPYAEPPVGDLRFKVCIGYKKIIF